MTMREIRLRLHIQEEQKCILPTSTSDYAHYDLGHRNSSCPSLMMMTLISEAQIGSKGLSPFFAPSLLAFEFSSNKRGKP
jgi:hypothetical protein